MKITRRKFCHVMAAIGVAALLLSGCGSQKAERAVNADGEPMFQLKLAHNMAEDHVVNIQLSAFAQEVAEKSEGSIQIQVIPNGTLGSETDMITQIQADGLDMAKVPASTLGNFSEQFNAFSVPYVFDSQEHYYNVMDSDLMEEIYKSTENGGFRGLFWLDSGARSFYTADTPIRVPFDLKGLKIRTMDSQMAIKMMKCLGGSATVMGYSDIYTGMQQGVIDGAENNVTALRDHGDVARYYCFDEHTRIPDMVVISTKIWYEMSEHQRDIMRECAHNASEEYKGRWADFEAQVLAAAEEKGVQFIRDVDKAAFQEAVAPIYEELKNEHPDTYEIVQRIRALA